MDPRLETDHAPESSNTVGEQEIEAFWTRWIHVRNGRENKDIFPFFVY